MVYHIGIRIFAREPAKAAGSMCCHFLRCQVSKIAGFILVKESLSHDSFSDVSPRLISGIQLLRTSRVGS